jgi:hypothetical protein
MIEHGCLVKERVLVTMEFISDFLLPYVPYNHKWKLDHLPQGLANVTQLLIESNFS